jgi:triphosphoribosyl-dephospho-CoA synthase
MTPEDLALAEAAVAAMRDELQAYPKPGLVSPVDSGAHADMDFDLMCRSANSLLQPFASLAAAGRVAGSFEQHLMPLGIEAERGMLAVTGGVNTHRGASHGGLVRRRTGRDGARREAARAFPAVFETGLPAYRQAREAGLDDNAAGIQTLFALMSSIDDTTVLYRGGLEAGSFVRQSAAEFLAEGGCHQPGWFEKAEALHRAFIARNLSAGGCADLLACTLLVSRCCSGP